MSLPWNLCGDVFVGFKLILVQPRTLISDVIILFWFWDLQKIKRSEDKRGLIVTLECPDSLEKTPCQQKRENALSS